MKTRILLIAAFLTLLASCKTDQKPTLRQGYFYTLEQGKAELKKLETMYNNSKKERIKKETSTCWPKL